MMYDLFTFEWFVIYGSLMLVSYTKDLWENTRCEPRESLRMFTEDLGEINSKKKARFATNSLRPFHVVFCVVVFHMALCEAQLKL